MSQYVKVRIDQDMLLRMLTEGQSIPPATCIAGLKEPVDIVDVSFNSFNKELELTIEDQGVFATKKMKEGEAPLLTVTYQAGPFGIARAFD